MDNDQNPVPQAPTVPETEMKMPEEQVLAAQPQARKSRMLLPMLAGILVLLLGILGALFLWGEAIIDTFMPAGGADESALDMTPATSTDPAATSTKESEAEPSLSTIEAELGSEDFSEFDAEMNAIDAELTATSTDE